MLRLFVKGLLVLALTLCSSSPVSKSLCKIETRESSQKGRQHYGRGFSRYQDR